MPKYFKSESDKRLDKLVKNPAIKKEIARERRAFVTKGYHLKPEHLKGTVAYFPSK